MKTTQKKSLSDNMKSDPDKFQHQKKITKMIKRALNIIL